MATELGSAYVQIIPSAKGISGSISKVFEPEASAAGTASGQSLGKSMLAAMGVAKIASVATNAIKGSLDSAISRFDIMQKFPKVMSALGFSAEDSNKSIKKLGDGIDGLPTRLDEVVSSTQQMTAITGDLNRSTDTVLGLNNAFLASGASQDAAARGQQQYNKIISTGKVELDSWQTLQETMPLALQKTAEAMGFTGKSAQNDLYKALQSGKIPIDQFTDKIIELGTGTGMLASLAKQNSLGIATSFGNLKNAVAKNVANMITKIDEVTQKTTGKTIAQNIDGLKVIINKSFAVIIASMDKLVPIIGFIKKAFSDLASSVGSFLSSTTGIKNFSDFIYRIQLAFSGLSMVIQGGIKDSAELKEYFLDAFSPGTANAIFAFGKILVSSFDIAKQAVSSLADILGKTISWIVKNFDLVKTAVVGLVAAFATFKTISTTISVVNGAMKAFSSTMTVFKVVSATWKNAELMSFALGNMAKTSKLAAAGQAVLNAVMSINPFVAIATAIVATVAVIIYLWKTNEGFRKAVIGIWEGIKNAFISAKDAIVNTWNGVSDFFTNTWIAIKNVVSNSAEAVKDSVVSAWNGIKSVSISIWNAVVNGVLTVVRPIVSGLMAIWNSMSDGLTMAWNGILAVATGVWELIKTVIMGPILILIDLITLNFDKLKEDLSLIWDGIKTAITTIWDGILDYYRGIAYAIYSAVTLVFETLKNWLTDAWNFISNTAVNTWNSLKDSVVNIANSLANAVNASISWIKDTAINVFNGMVNGAISLWEGLKNGVVNIANSIVSGAQNAWNSLVNGVNNAVNSVKNIFNTLANINLADIGKAIIDGFIGGLTSAWEKGKDFISGIGDWIREHKGPIEYDRKLLIPAGNAIMNGLNSGLIDRFKDVKQTVSSMASEMQDSFNVGSMINDELDSVRNSDLQAKLYSGQSLVKQVVGTVTGQTTNDDVIKAINDMANRPIMVSNQVDGREFSRLTAQPMNEEIDLYQRQMNRMAGILI